MKIISLNVSSGENFEKLLDFILHEAESTDVFCFQEMLFSNIPEFSKENHARLNLYQEVAKILPEFVGLGHMAPEYAKYYKYELLPDNVCPGLAVFVRKSLKILDSGGFVTYQDIPRNMDLGALITGNCQWVNLLDEKGGKHTIMHVHGMYQRGTDKIDTPERQEQSRILLKFIEKCDTKVVLLGDFNLLPDTKSIKLLGEKLDDLIKKYKITNTRSKLYKKPIRYADYCFTSRDLIEKGFRVIESEASDHLPLELVY